MSIWTRCHGRDGATSPGTLRYATFRYTNLSCRSSPGASFMAAMTLTEKILARHASRATVSPDDNIWVEADILMTHDVCGPGTIGVFHKHFGKDAKVWDRNKVVVIPDHYIFTA